MSVRILTKNVEVSINKVRCHATGYGTNEGELQIRNQGNEHIKIYHYRKKSIPVMTEQHVQCERGHGYLEYMI